MTASTMTADGSVSLGLAQAKAAFEGNAQNISDIVDIIPSYAVARSGSSLNSQISASGTYHTAFASLVGVGSVAVSAKSAATTSFQQFVNFYVMVDVSESMGLPSTAGETQRLARIDPDQRDKYPNGCVVACHFAGSQGYKLTRNGGSAANTPVIFCQQPGTSSCIQIRLDAVGYAVQNLLKTATTQATVPNQYGVGLYPFVANLWSSYAPVTTNLSGSPADPNSLPGKAAGLANLLDPGDNASLGSGGTHINNAVSTMNGVITTVGSGATKASPADFVFLVTDGSQDNQEQWNGHWWGSNHATTMDPTTCQALKDRHITVAVLYIPYLPIPDPTDFANGEDYAANATIPAIPGALTACASNGWFFTANSPTDIDAALQKMFYQAVSSVRLTS